MTALRNSNLCYVKLFRRCKYWRYHQIINSKRTFADDINEPNSSPDLNLLDEPIVLGFGIFPFTFIANVFRARWFSYKYDKTFEPNQQFADAARNVFLLVTEKLRNQDFDALENLVTNDLFAKLKTALSRLNDADRTRLLDIKEKDIMMMLLGRSSFRTESNASRKYFDMLFALHCIRNMDEIDRMTLRQGDVDQQTPKFQEISKFFDTHAVFANFRLTKQVEPSVSEEWTVSYINYSLSTPPSVKPFLKKK